MQIGTVFRTLTSREIFEDSKSTSGRTLCVFGSHTFVPISWMCKKQTAVSHSSTESEIISLDTGLRLDGLPALELWDLIVSVFGIFLMFQIERGNLRMVKTNTTNLTIKSMRWKTLILSPRMSNLRVKKLFVCVWGQWNCNQSDRWKDEVPYNETCFQYSQSCSWLVVWSNQSGHQNPNQIHRHQKPTRRHSNQREFHTWWVESFVVPVQY